MKPLIIFLALLINSYSFSQTQNFSGTYARNLIVTKNDTITYKLNLNSDSTFFFHSYTYRKRGIPNIVNRYGKGKWNASGHIISFMSEKKDIDDRHQLDFTGTKARFIIKNPRNLSNKVIKTRLRFYESNIYWIPKTELFKQ